MGSKKKDREMSPLLRPGYGPVGDHWQRRCLPFRCVVSTSPPLRRVRPTSQLSHLLYVTAYGVRTLTLPTIPLATVEQPNQVVPPDTRYQSKLELLAVIEIPGRWGDKLEISHFIIGGDKSTQEDKVTWIWLAWCLAGDDPNHDFRPSRQGDRP